MLLKTHYQTLKKTIKYKNYLIKQLFLCYFNLYFYNINTK